MNIITHVHFVSQLNHNLNEENLTTGYTCYWYERESRKTRYCEMQPR